VPLTVIPAPAVWIAHVLLGLCIVIPRVGPLMYLRFHPSAWSAQPTSHGMKTSLVRMPFPPPELLVLPSTPPPPSLGRTRGEIKDSSRCCKELSACYAVVVLRMLFNCWYISPTPLVEGAGNVSKSATTFWLALA
jgi:hypothetical protein